MTLLNPFQNDPMTSVDLLEPFSPQNVGKDFNLTQIIWIQIFIQ
jgi:hypothetical protein